MLLNLNRPNVRGIKKCRFCGYYNGNRSKSCKNQNCPQFLECNVNNRLMKSTSKNVPLRMDSPIDPITIHTSDDVQYFSVRVAEKLSGNSRDFVKIEESTIETDRNTVIICRTAVCYVDSCMASATNFANCPHIVECTSQVAKGSASQVPIIRTKFLKFFSHLTEAERTELWDYYATCSTTAVQQLKGNLFVVKANWSCGNKENSRGLNVSPGLTDFVHCELGYDRNVVVGREPTFTCSCRKSVSSLCHHILLLYSAIDGSGSLREQFKMHLDNTCKQLELHELDLFDLETNLSIDWDMKSDAFIDHMINEEILLDESLELEFMGDFGDFLQDPVEEENLLVKPDQQKKVVAAEWQARDKDEKSNLNLPTATAATVDKMSLSVSFDTILASIIERMNCNFNGCSSSAEVDTSAEEFVFYVHNDFFSCLSDRFFSGPDEADDSAKTRFPCHIQLHNTGAYVGLSTQVYRFSNPDTVARIFTSKSATIILDRIFYDYHNRHPHHHGGAVQAVDNYLGHPPLTPPPYSLSSDAGLSATTSIKKSIALREDGEEVQDNYVTIAWTADALPTSSHGELKISFRYHYVRE